MTVYEGMFRVSLFLPVIHVPTDRDARGSADTHVADATKTQQTRQKEDRNGTRPETRSAERYTREPCEYSMQSVHSQLSWKVVECTVAVGRLSLVKT